MDTVRVNGPCSLPNWIRVLPMHVAEDIGLRSMWYRTAALPGNRHKLLLIPTAPQPKSVHHDRALGVNT